MNDYNGGPIDETYVNKRLRNEPLVEITQAKGTSETHPFLSKNDEWADFEAPTNHPGEEILLYQAKSSVPYLNLDLALERSRPLTQGLYSQSI